MTHTRVYLKNLYFGMNQHDIYKQFAIDGVGTGFHGLKIWRKGSIQTHTVCSAFISFETHEQAAHLVAIWHNKVIPSLTPYQIYAEITDDRAIPKAALPGPSTFPQAPWWVPRPHPSPPEGASSSSRVLQPTPPVFPPPHGLLMPPSPVTVAEDIATVTAPTAVFDDTATTTAMPTALPGATSKSPPPVNPISSAEGVFQDTLEEYLEGLFAETTETNILGDPLEVEHTVEFEAFEEEAFDIIFLNMICERLLWKLYNKPYDFFFRLVVW